MTRPERVFAGVALVAGLLLAFVMPPGSAPDEARHLSRVYLMSEGSFGVPGTRAPHAEIPKSIPELHRAVEGEDHRRPPRRTVGEAAALLRQPLEPGQRVAVVNAGVYPPVVYLPQLVGVAAGRALGLAPAALVYLGRITGLLAWVALTALAIRLAPARRWTLALLALTPMSVASAASISGDPVTSAAALLFTVFAVRAIGGSGPLAPAEVAALLGAALGLGLAKPGYWPLALAVLAIPAERFEPGAEHASRMPSRGRAANADEAPSTDASQLPVSRVASRRRAATFIKLWLAVGVLFAATVPALAWMAHAQRSEPAPPLAGADPAAQLHFVLGHPLAFAAILLRTISIALPSYWTTFVGELGPLIVRLPAVVYAGWGIALVAAIAADGPPLALRRGARVGLALASAASVGAVFTFAYLGWNPVGEPVIRGVQGRYWAPALPLLAFALPARSGALPGRLRVALVAFAACSLAAAAVAVAATYYRA